MEKVIDYFDLPVFIKYWFQTLYNNLLGRVMVDGLSSDDFHITKGLKQGSPLSLILFILGLEFFARAIRGNPKITGEAGEKKINLLVDDTLLSILVENESLLEIVSTLTEFEQLSGLKANLDKSDITRIGAIKGSSLILPAGRNFTWTSGVFSYLGIKFSVDTAMSKLNYSTILQQSKIMAITDAYHNDSELGKILIHKQLHIYQLVYRFSLVPAPNNETLDKLDSDFVHFIWKG